mmetsp:Transcript_20060/g.58035  ORF Transcript_20060/g.58035 Transcript_20060/m.58035 type:complete len:98 (+) Transcript_20060:1118-1411(+)
MTKHLYLACDFILGADRQTCKSLIHDLKNSFTKGKNNFPRSIDEAYALMCNWNTNKSVSIQDIQDAGIIIYQKAGYDNNKKIPTGSTLDKLGARDMG